MTGATSGERQRREPGSGFQVGRLFGIPLFATPSWFISAAIITVLVAPRFELQVLGVEGGAAYAVAGAYVVLLYLSVVAHELSHSLVARRLGLSVRRITLHLLGGQSELDEPPTPGKQALVAAAGPGISLVIGAASLGVHQVLDDHSVVWALTFALGVGNLLLGVFNLLPGLPLDGGQILRALVWRVTGRASTGIRAAAQGGRVLAGAAVVAGVWATVQSRPLSFVYLVIGALLAGFMWAGANQGMLTARLRDRLATLSVRSLTRRAIPVQPDLPLSEAIRRAHEVGAGAIVVVGRDGAPEGVVSEATVTAMPEHRRPWTRAGDVARTLVDGMKVAATLDGEHMIRAMHEHPATEYLVVEASGQVFGVLVARDVERALARG